MLGPELARAALPIARDASQGRCAAPGFAQAGPLCSRHGLAVLHAGRACCAALVPQFSRRALPPRAAGSCAPPHRAGARHGCHACAASELVRVVAIVLALVAAHWPSCSQPCRACRPP